MAIAIGDDQAERHRADHEQPRNVAEHVGGRPPAQSVEQRVGGDRDPVDEPQTERLERGQPAVVSERETDDAGGDDEDRDQSERSDALAGKGPRGAGDQRRRDAAGDRVDVRQVAEAVAVTKAQVVRVVHQDRAGQIRPARACRGLDQEQERQGAQAADRDDHAEPDERIAARLDQRIPAGMQHRRRQHQAQHDRVQDARSPTDRRAGCSSSPQLPWLTTSAICSSLGSQRET